MPTKNNMRRTWMAMKKFADDLPLTEREWDDLSWLSLIDRTNLYFGPENVRLAKTSAERVDNLKFYLSLGPAVH